MLSEFPSKILWLFTGYRKVCCYSERNGSDVAILWNRTGWNRATRWYSFNRRDSGSSCWKVSCVEGMSDEKRSTQISPDRPAACSPLCHSKNGIQGLLNVRQTLSLSCNPKLSVAFELGSHHVAQDDLKFGTVFSQPLEFWGYRCAPSHPATWHLFFQESVWHVHFTLIFT